MLVTTPRALGTNETPFQSATCQVRFELLANESRQAATSLLLPFEKGICVLLNYVIQHCFLGSMRPIARAADPDRR